MALRCQFWLPMFTLHLSFCHARHDFGIHNIRLLRGQRLNCGSPACFHYTTSPRKHILNVECNISFASVSMSSFCARPIS